jgi:hypothetical protein
LEIPALQNQAGIVFTTSLQIRKFDLFHDLSCNRGNSGPAASGDCSPFPFYPGLPQIFARCPGKGNLAFGIDIALWTAGRNERIAPQKERGCGIFQAMLSRGHMNANL